MLYGKELKKVCFSFVYVLFLGLLLFSWYTNFRGVTQKEIAASQEQDAPAEIAGGSVLREPHENDESYGTKKAEDPEKIMCGGTDMLIIEYLNNSYATYPFGYYKEVVLSEEEQDEILGLIEEITGLTEEQIHHLPDGYFPAVNGNIIHMGNGAAQNGDGGFSFETGESGDAEDTGGSSGHFISQVSYGRFRELMAEAERIVGAGSRYSLETLTEYYGQTEMTYEEVAEEYSRTVNDDKVSGAFARLFCDYMTRVLGLYPAFVVVVFWLKDRRSRMKELIDSKQISSSSIVLARFLAVLTAVMLPAVLLSLESLIPLLGYSSETGIAIDGFAFMKYIVWWLLPTAMIVVASGMFLTILTSTPLAILVQFVWWYADSAATGLSGDTRWYTLMIRHNLLNGSELVREDLAVICLNRGLLVLLSAILLWLSVTVYDKKRGGKPGYGYAIQKHRSFFKNGFTSRLQN